MITAITHSNLIKKHWNWQSNIRFNNFSDFIIEIPKHGFTHCDAPAHMIKSGKSLTECKLDKLCGWATLIDVSECLGDKPISGELLEKKANNTKEGEIIVLRSNLSDTYPNSSKDYWNFSPFLEDSGSKWLVKKKPKAIVFDFPQDRAAKDLQFRIVKNKEFTEHQIILGADIMHVEHAVKLNLINEGRFYLFSLPINLPKADGGNCTPISIFGLEEKEYKIIDHSSIMVNNDIFKSFLTLSFENGDQVQETGFYLNGLTHTCAIIKDNSVKEMIFNNPVSNNFNIINDLNELKNNKSEIVLYEQNQKLNEEQINKIIDNVNFNILCLNQNVSTDIIGKLMKKIDILFINVENIKNIKENSYLIFGCLNIENSKVLPSRIVSIY